MTPDPHTLSGAYAVNALDERERPLFEQHLATCAECRAEVAGLIATAARLGDAVATHPPPYLRDRVLTQARQTRQLRPPVPAQRAEPPAWRFRLLLAAASVLAILAGTLGALAWQANERAGDLRAHNDRIAAVVSAPDAVTVSGPLDGGGHAAAVASPARGEIALLAGELPALAEGQAYQLWMIAADQAHSGGVIDLDDGRALHVAAADLSGINAVALSVEPAGGSSAPTTDPVWMLTFDVAERQTN